MSFPRCVCLSISTDIINSREQHHGLVITCVVILNSDWSDSQNEQHSIVTEKTAQAFSDFETLWFLLAFVLMVLCSNQDAFQYSTTKNGFKFCFYMLSHNVFYFHMIISDLHIHTQKK